MREDRKRLMDMAQRWLDLAKKAEESSEGSTP